MEVRFCKTRLQTIEQFFKGGGAMHQTHDFLKLLLDQGCLIHPVSGKRRLPAAKERNLSSIPEMTEHLESSSGAGLAVIPKGRVRVLDVDDFESG